MISICWIDNGELKLPEVQRLKKSRSAASPTDLVSSKALKKVTTEDGKTTVQIELDYPAKTQGSVIEEMVRAKLVEAGIPAGLGSDGAASNNDLDMVGDIAVELRYRGGALPQLLARPLRFVGGIGGIVFVGVVQRCLLAEGFFDVCQRRIAAHTKGCVVVCHGVVEYKNDSLPRWWGLRWRRFCL